VTQDEIIQFAAALPGVAVETASQASGAPEVAWGDSFIYYDQPGQDTPPDRRFPFATIVIKDYPGWDEFSDLSRDGVFRLPGSRHGPAPSCLWPAGLDLDRLPWPADQRTGPRPHHRGPRPPG
jgi:hypothetical protein